MKRIMVNTLVAAAASVLVSSCGKSPNKYTDELDQLQNYKQPADTDVTSMPKYNFLSFASTVWKTKVKTALIKIKLYTGKDVVCLSPPDVFDAADPHYAPIPNARVTSMLPVGTHVHIERLLRDNGIGSQLWVIATVESGTNSQNNIYIGRHFLANNEFKPTGPTSSTNWDVNPDMLEPVTNAP